MEAALHANWLPSGLPSSRRMSTTGQARRKELALLQAAATVCSLCELIKGRPSRLTQ